MNALDYVAGGRRPGRRPPRGPAPPRQPRSPTPPPPGPRRGRNQEEYDEDELSFMTPAGRLARRQAEETRLREERAAAKAGFDGRKNATIVQHQTLSEAFNAAYKRKHEDDSVAQANERKHAFLNGRVQRITREVAARQLKEETKDNKQWAQDLLETIYRELGTHELHPSKVERPSYNPYTAILDNPASRHRFEGFRRTITLEILAIIMLSPSFCESLQRLEDRPEGLVDVGDETPLYLARLEQLKKRINREKLAIRSFAHSRRIKYITAYNKSARGTLAAPLQPPNARFVSIRCPYEYFRSADGGIKQTTFKPKLPNSVEAPFKHITENIYKKNDFESHWQPKNWLPSWPYPPSDMQHPCREWGKNYPVCVFCARRTGTSRPIVNTRSTANTRSVTCDCKAKDIFSKVLVEVMEYDAYTPGEINRGVRVLQKIPENFILGEYCGRLIPFKTEEEWGDNTYAMLFDGPPFVDDDGIALEIDPDAMDESSLDYNPDPIASVTSGAEGSWPRFLNCPIEGERANVRFDSEVVAGKSRITVRALRDIQFGEQLLVSYGDHYWPGQQSKAENKEKGKGRGRGVGRKMAGFSGFIPPESSDSSN